MMERMVGKWVAKEWLDKVDRWVMNGWIDGQQIGDGWHIYMKG